MEAVAGTGALAGAGLGREVLAGDWLRLVASWLSGVVVVLGSTTSLIPLSGELAPRSGEEEGVPGGLEESSEVEVLEVVLLVLEMLDTAGGEEELGVERPQVSCRGAYSLTIRTRSTCFLPPAEDQEDVLLLTGAEPLLSRAGWRAEGRRREPLLCTLWAWLLLSCEYCWRTCALRAAASSTALLDLAGGGGGEDAHLLREVPPISWLLRTLRLPLRPSVVPSCRLS